MNIASNNTFSNHNSYFFLNYSQCMEIMKSEMCCQKSARCSIWLRNLLTWILSVSGDNADLAEYLFTGSRLLNTVVTVIVCCHGNRQAESTEH